MRRFEHDGSGRVVLQATCNYLIPLAATVYSFAAKPRKCLKNIQPSKLMTRVRFPSPAPTNTSAFRSLRANLAAFADENAMCRFLLFVTLICASVLNGAPSAPAQTYPTRTVHFIIPFGPASASDITARLFADRLTARWGRPVVVENRPGGDGLVALKVFVDSHDDHTLFFGPAAAFLVHLYDQDEPPYTLSDIAPIVGVYVTVLAISVPTAMNVNTMDELVALARAQPGKLNAAAATGNSDFLIFGFIKDTDLQIARVPYRDIMQAPNDLAESRIQVLSTSLATV